MEYLHYWDAPTANPDHAAYLDSKTFALASPGHESIHEAIRRWRNDGDASAPDGASQCQQRDWHSSDGCGARLGHDRVHATRFMDRPATIGAQRSCSTTPTDGPMAPVS
jgi:hypothetical protein